MQPLRLLELARSRAASLALATILGAVFGYWSSFLEDSNYEATARTFVTSSAESSSAAIGAALPELRRANYLDFITSDAFIERTLKSRGFSASIIQVRKHLSVTSPKDTSLIDIGFNDPDPDRAALLANAFAEQFTRGTSTIEASGSVRASLVREADADSTVRTSTRLPNTINGALALLLATFGVFVRIASRGSRESILRVARTRRISLRWRDLSRPTAPAVVAIIVGLFVIGVAAIGGSGTSSGFHRALTTNDRIKPVDPLVPSDKYAVQPTEEAPQVDIANPFATSSGEVGTHQVTVRVSGNGYINIAVYYRDRKQPKEISATDYRESRRITAKSPLAAVSVQLPGFVPGAATMAKCVVEIDGVSVSSKTTRDQGDVKVCFG